MDKSQDKRQQNFELLRIVAMILIIIHHYAYHGGLSTINELSTNRFIGEFIEIGGKIGVNLFVLVSGYFLIQSKFKIKKIIKLILEVMFYSIGILLIVWIFQCTKLDLKGILKSILPISYNLYWFATAYIGMYMFMPFLNKLVKNITKQNYQMLLIIGLVLFSVIPTFLPSANSFTNNLVWFIELYLIAGYIKLYDIARLENKKKCISYSIIIYVLLFVVSLTITFITTKYFKKGFGITHFNNMYSVPIVIISITIFMWFKKIQIKGGKLIEIMASSSFAVYLIHDNALIRKLLWQDIFKVEAFYHTSVIVIILHIIVTVIAIYGFAILVDSIRRKLLEEPLFKTKIGDSYFDKIDDYMNI